MSTCISTLLRTEHSFISELLFGQNKITEDITMVPDRHIFFTFLKPKQFICETRGTNLNLNIHVINLIELNTV